jgi:hypothetical protein
MKVLRGTSRDRKVPLSILSLVRICGLDNLEIGLGMLADRADLESFCTLVDMTAVHAFPGGLRTF